MIISLNLLFFSSFYFFFFFLKIWLWSDEYLWKVFDCTFLRDNDDVIGCLLLINLFVIFIDLFLLKRKKYWSKWIVKRFRDFDKKHFLWEMEKFLKVQTVIFNRIEENKSTVTTNDLVLWFGIHANLPLKIDHWFLALNKYKSMKVSRLIKNRFQSRIFTNSSFGCLLFS